eukprot:6466356-Amphidinium_carterae.1
MAESAAEADNTRKWCAWGGGLRKSLKEDEATPERIIECLAQLLNCVESPLSCCTRPPFHTWQEHFSPSVFPLPLLAVSKLPWRGRKHLRQRRKRSATLLANCMIGCLNWMHAGSSQWRPNSWFPPSRAQ